MEAILYSPG